MITKLVFQLQESKAKQIKSRKHLEISHIRLYKLGMQAKAYSIIFKIETANVSQSRLGLLVICVFTTSKLMWKRSYV